jgi:hypothetical protein
LEFGELPAFRGVIGKLIVGEDGAWNNVRSHMKTSPVGCSSRGYVSTVRGRRSNSKLNGWRPNAAGVCPETIECLRQHRGGA